MLTAIDDWLKGYSKPPLLGIGFGPSMHPINDSLISFSWKWRRDQMWVHDTSRSMRVRKFLIQVIIRFNDFGDRTRGGMRKFKTSCARAISSKARTLLHKFVLSWRLARTPEAGFLVWNLKLVLCYSRFMINSWSKARAKLKNNFSDIN